MGYSDPDKQREYQRKWRAKRRADFFQDKICVKCESTENLELDHIDRSTKISNSIWSWSKKRRDEEIAKCQVLCEDCHTVRSAGQVKEWCSGELHPNHKLTATQVEEIRMLYRQGGFTYRRLASMYGVRYTYIGRLIKNESRRNG